MVDDVFECMVHATKLDIESDYRELSTQIDRTVPLWRYSLNALTDGSEGKGRQGPHFPLLWLKRFESLHEDLADGGHAKCQVGFLQNKMSWLAE